MPVGSNLNTCTFLFLVSNLHQRSEILWRCLKCGSLEPYPKLRLQPRPTSSSSNPYPSCAWLHCKSAYSSSSWTPEWLPGLASSFHFSNSSRLAANRNAWKHNWTVSGHSLSTLGLGIYWIRLPRVAVDGSQQLPILFQLRCSVARHSCWVGNYRSIEQFRWIDSPTTFAAWDTELGIRRCLGVGNHGRSAGRTHATFHGGIERRVKRTDVKDQASPPRCNLYRGKIDDVKANQNRHATIQNYTSRSSTSNKNSTTLRMKLYSRNNWLWIFRGLYTSTALLWGWLAAGAVRVSIEYINFAERLLWSGFSMWWFILK